MDHSDNIGADITNQMCLDKEKQFGSGQAEKIGMDHT